MGRPCSSCRFVFSLRLRRLVLAWCCVLAASLQATAQRDDAPPPGQVEVRVGVILNLTSSIGQRRRVGIEMALEDYYAAHPGSRTRVTPRFRDSGGQVVGAASAGKLRSSPLFQSSSEIHLCFEFILLCKLNSIYHYLADQALATYYHACFCLMHE